MTREELLALESRLLLGADDEETARLLVGRRIEVRRTLLDGRCEWIEWVPAYFETLVSSSSGRLTRATSEASSILRVRIVQAPSWKPPSWKLDVEPTWAVSATAVSMQPYGLYWRLEIPPE